MEISHICLTLKKKKTTQSDGLNVCFGQYVYYCQNFIELSMRMLR